MISLLISMLALIFSIFSFYWGWKSRERRERAAIWGDSPTKFEQNLAEWPEAFQLYGVDLEEAGKQSITAKQITYLILAVNYFILYTESYSRSLKKEIEASTYARRLFSYSRTRDVWKYARRCISDKYREDVDAYLKEVHEASYEKLPCVYYPRTRIPDQKGCGLFL